MKEILTLQEFETLQEFGTLQEFETLGGFHEFSNENKKEKIFECFSVLY